MRKIYLLGSVHNASILPSLKERIIKEGIQVTIREFVKSDDGQTKNNLISDPFLFLFNWFWRRIPFSSKDRKSIHLLSDECEIGYYDDVDVPLTQLIRYAHKQPTYLLALVTTLISFVLVRYCYGNSNVILILIASLILSIILYSVLLIFATKKYRDETMVSNAVSYIEQNKHDRILFSCGYQHTKGIARLFRMNMFDVEILDGYQKSLLLSIFKHLPMLD